jgi:hypothetical protein
VNATVKDILIASLPAVIPTLSVLVGILLNQTGMNRLDGRLTGIENRLDGRLTAVERSVDDLGKQLHSDIIMLVGRDTDKAERLARLEERTKS